MKRWRFHDICLLDVTSERAWDLIRGWLREWSGRQTMEEMWVEKEKDVEKDEGLEMCRERGLEKTEGSGGGELCSFTYELLCNSPHATLEDALVWSFDV